MAFVQQKGSHLECQYALITFGIRRDFIPLSDTGELDLGRFDQLLKYFQSNDNGRAPVPITPTSIDILLGRGRPFQEFPGNLRLAIIVDKYRGQYAQAGRCDKAILSEHLVDVIKRGGSRFLKRSDGDSDWIEVDDDVAKDKVSHGFRTKTKTRRKAPAKTTSTKPRPTAPISFEGGLDSPMPISTQSQFSLVQNDDNNHHYLPTAQDSKRLRASPNPLL